MLLVEVNHISKQTHLNNSATIKVGIFSFYIMCGSYRGEEQKTDKKLTKKEKEKRKKLK